MAKNIKTKDFERRIVLRNIRVDDYGQIIDLEQKCFPAMQQWTQEQIESQLSLFPEGQFCIVDEDRIVASCASLIIDFDEYDEEHTWTEITDGGFISNHDPEGETLYGIEIMVHPDYRGMKLSRRLYDARKELARERNLKRIVLGGRIPGYKLQKDRMSAREYVDKVVDKSLYDPVLTAQTAAGFALKRLMPAYLKDEQSEGYATLLEWVNLDCRPDLQRKTLLSRPVRLCGVQYQMRPIKNFEEFAQQCEFFVDVASGYKSDFAVFPELLTLQLLSFVHEKQPGDAVRRLSDFTPRYLELFSDLAIRYNVNILGGSHFTIEGDTLYNIAYLFQRNGTINKQYKLHITPAERRWWGVKPGNRIEVFDTDRGKVSIQICYDVEFPEVSRIAVEQGARIIMVPFCTDERHGYLRVRYCAQARCIENQVFALISGTTGNLPFVEQMDIQYAQSAVLTPSDFGFSRDAIAAECQPNIETVVIHDVDLELLRRHRHSGTVLNWLDRRTDLYEVRLKS